MSHKPIKVVIDTQVWVFVFLSETITVSDFNSKQPYRAILEALAAGEFVPVFSPETLDELKYILTRSANVARKFNIDVGLAEYFIDAVSSSEVGAVVVEIDDTLKVSSDPDDDAFVQAAITGKSRYLVSEDSDLHEAAVKAELRKHGIRVVYPKQFRKALDERKAEETVAIGEP